MKRLATIFLLILFVLPGCDKKHYIEIPAPTEGPDPAALQPSEPPPSVNEAP